MNYSSVGQWIKYVRINQKLNQVDFSKKIGVQHTYVSKIENDRETVSLSLLKKICNVFDENLEEAKALFTQKKEAVTHEVSSNKENEMNQEFLEQQIKTLVDTLEKSQEQLTKQMEINMQLVNALTDRSSQPNYMESLGEIKQSHEKLSKRHDRIEERFDEILGYFRDFQKKEDQLETGT